MTNYTFSLDRLHISRTRSHSTDTNFLTLSVKVGSNSPTTIYGKLGDMGDGDFDLAQRFQQTPAPGQASMPPPTADGAAVGFTAQDSDAVIINYLITNSGHDQDPIAKLEDGLTKLFSQVFGQSGGGTTGTGTTGTTGDVTSAVTPRLPTGTGDGGDGGPPGGGSTPPTLDTSMDGGGGNGASYGAIVADILTGLWSLLDPNCDGPVVAAAITTTGAELSAKTANGAIVSPTADYEGTDSADGCGANSRYFLTYSLKGTPSGSPSGGNM